MKRAIVVLGLAAGLSASVMAADFTGYIIDQQCADKPDMRGDVDCANKCIKGGSPAVGIARLSVESSGPRVTHFTTPSFV